MDHTDIISGGDGSTLAANGKLNLVFSFIRNYLFSSFFREDTGRKAIKIKQFVQDYQNAFTAVEKCPKPVIAAVQKACIGAGVDIVCI